MGTCHNLNVYFTNNTDTCQIRGSHSGFAKDSSLLGYEAMSLVTSFRYFEEARRLPLQGQPVQEDSSDGFNLDCFALKMTATQAIETSSTTRPVT